MLSILLWSFVFTSLELLIILPFLYNLAINEYLLPVHETSTSVILANSRLYLQEKLPLQRARLLFPKSFPATCLQWCLSLLASSILHRHLLWITQMRGSKMKNSRVPQGKKDGGMEEVELQWMGLNVPSCFIHSASPTLNNQMRGSRVLQGKRDGGMEQVKLQWMGLSCLSIVNCYEPPQWVSFRVPQHKREKWRDGGRTAVKNGEDARENKRFHMMPSLGKGGE